MNSLSKHGPTMTFLKPYTNQRIQMNGLWVVVLIPHLLLIHCTDPVNYTGQLQYCHLRQDVTVISGETRNSSCSYFNVYYYKNDIYRTCVCCL